MGEGRRARGSATEAAPARCFRSGPRPGTRRGRGSRARLGPALAALLPGFLLVACEGEERPPDLDACGLVSLQEASAAGFDEPGVRSVSGGAQVCTWLDPLGRSAVLQVFASAAAWSRTREVFESYYGGPSKEVTGIGEGAFHVSGATEGLPTASVGVLGRRTTFTVQVMGHEDPAVLEADALRLARAVAGRL